MVLQLLDPTIGRIRRHELTDCPFIDRAGSSVSLEEGWGDERLQDKPSANVHTIRVRQIRKNTMERGE